MTTISKDNKVVTLINIFTVDPKNQQRLVDMLVVATAANHESYARFRSGKHSQEFRR